MILIRNPNQLRYRQADRDSVSDLAEKNLTVDATEAVELIVLIKIVMVLVEIVLRSELHCINFFDLNPVSTIGFIETGLKFDRNRI